MRFTPVLLFFVALPAAFAGVTGDWVTPDKAVVKIYPCGSHLCARLVHLGPNSPVSKDTRNPDQKLQNAPLCGLQIGRDFVPVDSDHAKDGHLYDPMTGRTYSGFFSSNGDTLKLRGYVGLAVFGRTETWQRAPAGTPVCAGQ